MSVSNRGLLKPGVCTSSSRPLNPFTGQTIFETDTLRIYFWSGVGGWILLADDPTFAQRYALIGIATATASTWSNATATLSDITVTAGQAPILTLTLDPTRWYQASFQCRATSTVDGDVAVFRIMEDGVSRISGKTRMITTASLTVAINLLFQPATALSTIYKIQGQRETGTGTISLAAAVTGPMQFSITPA